MKTLFNYYFAKFQKFNFKYNLSNSYGKSRLFYSSIKINNNMIDYNNKGIACTDMANNLDIIINREKNILKSRFIDNFVGGFKSYNLHKIFDNFVFSYKPSSQILSVDKDVLLMKITDFLNQLEEDKTYSVLFVASSWNEQRMINTLSDHSIIIHKDYSPSILCEE